LITGSSSENDSQAGSSFVTAKCQLYVKYLL
jgi:hypothetical protein